MKEPKEFDSRLSSAILEIQDLICIAGVGKLREIDLALDSLKMFVEDNVMAVAGYGGE